MYLDRAIFVVYHPGAYGSFLRHCINLSSDVFDKEKKTTNIFWQGGQAHNNISEFIKFFHDGDDLNRWYSLTHEESLKYLSDNWVGTPELEQSNKFYVHRIAGPKSYDKVREYFPKSKFVYISFTKENVEEIADLMANKTLYGYMRKIKFREPEKFQHYQTLNNEDVINIYKKICAEMVESLEQPTVDEFNLVKNVFEFKFDWFYNKEIFVKKYNEMCGFLEIAKADIQDLYDNFAKVNNIQEKNDTMVL